jgi:hypothetical protein
MLFAAKAECHLSALKLIIREISKLFRPNFKFRNDVEVTITEKLPNLNQFLS